MALDRSYPCMGPDTGWATILAVFDDFCIAKITVDGSFGPHKIPYTVANDAITLGPPVAVDRAWLLKDTTTVVVRQESMRATLVASGDDAQKLLDELIDKNPLFASIKDTPNTHLVVFDLTSVGRPSQHAGKYKYQLAKGGLAKALPTLISKPIHVTADLDGHFDEGADPKPIGVFLGGVGIDAADGSVTLRAIGTLWGDDFPDEIEEIQAKIAELGASYEITYSPLTAARRISPDVIEIGEWQFAGGAILKKTAAAHPETQLLVADFALMQGARGRFAIHDTPHRIVAWRSVEATRGLTPQEKHQVRDRIMARAQREGDAWARAYAKANGQWIQRKAEGGGDMTESKKYPGFTVDQEAALDVIIASALQSAGDKARADKLEVDLTLMTAERDAAVKAGEDKAAALTAQLTESTIKLEQVQALLDAEAAKTAERELEEKVTVEVAKLGTKFGFDQKQLAARRPLVKKLIAGLPLTIGEAEQLYAGSKHEPRVPLFAGAGDQPKFTPEDVKKQFPALARVAR